MSGISSRTRSLICSRVRLATGCGVATNSKKGLPYALAIARAGTMKASVQMLTAGTPARSSRIPSAKLAALHEPQSPIPATTKSQFSRICRIWLFSTGVPK
jgi:hypothetical protein